MSEIERLVLPPVSEASWSKYKALQLAPLEAMRRGVLPNIDAALVAYDALEASLTDPDGGGYEDDDQADLALYHPQAIALVAPSINAMIEHMEEIYTIAQQVDAAFVADGRAPLFGVRMPVEEQPA